MLSKNLRLLSLKQYANVSRYTMVRNPMRIFSSDGSVGLGDIPDVFKVNYTEEFE